MAAEAAVLVTGASGFLGRAVLEILHGRGVPCVAAVHASPAQVPPGAGTLALDLGAPASVAGALRRAGAEFVVHAGALASVAACEKDPERARAVNLEGTVALLAGARRWVFASTDLVFDGTSPPYHEASPPRALSVYGRTKADAEEALRARGGGLVARLPLLFGRSPDGRRGATDMVRAAAEAGRSATLFTDEFRCPLHVEEAARALVDLLLATEAEGLVHVPGPERVSRHELGRRFVAAAGLPAACIRPGLRREAPGGVPRPGDLHLVSRRLGALLPVGFPALDAMLARS